MALVYYPSFHRVRLLVALMGLMLIGVFRPKWYWKEMRFQFGNKRLGYLGSILVGITFAAGWIPCIEPILAAILAFGMTNPEQSIYYIIAYTHGFAIPFFVMSFFITRIKKIVQYSSLMMKLGGGLMILTGFLLYTDQMTKITIALTRVFGGFTGF